MKVYHMSDTLQLGTAMTLDYKKNMELTQPFVQALEQSEECFYAMVYNAKYLWAVLKKFGFSDMQTDYTKWAVEGIFEYIRKTEFPQCYCRLTSNYFFECLADCKELFEIDWGKASEAERKKIKLFEIALDDDFPQKRDMRLFDEAYDAAWENDQFQSVFDSARRYFSGSASNAPTWELLSDKKAIAVAEITEYLHKRDS